jgi:arginine decarboxylase
VLIAGTGGYGYAIEDDLVAAGMAVESADRDTVVPIITLADDERTVDAFLDVLIAAIERHRTAPRKTGIAASWTVVPEVVMCPREAFFADNETVSAHAAVGRVSAELIAPYPPGVPVLAPGELITADAVESLLEIKADGGRIAYAADPSLATLQVIMR